MFAIRDLQRELAIWNRDRKWEAFQRLFPYDPDARILDVGFSPMQDGGTNNYLEKHYPRLDRITALTVMDPDLIGDRYPGLNIVRYDGGRMPFEDGEFDIVWSNAVVEHVGGPAEQVRFLAEINRVGKRHFVTTPNRWFPVELHTRLPLLHWLPKPVFDRLLRVIGQDWAAGDYMHLLSGRQFKRQLVTAGASHPILLKNRLGGPVVDFVAVW